VLAKSAEYLRLQLVEVFRGGGFGVVVSSNVDVDYAA
jgi:hypothetical protein